MKKLLFAFVSACTTASAPMPPTIQLVDLTSEDLETECGYLADTYPHKRLTCGTKSEVFGFGSAESCVKDLTDANQLHPGCKATTGELEACMEYLYSMTCETAGLDVPDSCKHLFSSTCD